MALHGGLSTFVMLTVHAPYRNATLEVFGISFKRVVQKPNQVWNKSVNETGVVP